MGMQQGTPPGYGPPLPRRPAADDAASATSDAPHYLIAFKNHNIYSAVAYWVDGDTLHYFTNGNTHNQVSLALVDRDLTERLNEGSGAEVKLPPAAPAK
jgi:endonuclease YncB( thermonuclease family)